MKKKVCYKDLATIAGNLSKLYEQGIPLINIFSLLEEMPLKRDYKLFLKKVECQIQQGYSLEEMFSMESDLFPKFFTSMISIGEKTGRIIYVLKGLEMYYSKMDSIIKTLVSKLSYPSFLIIALVLLGFMAVFFFLPNMTEIITSMDKELPPIYDKVLSIQNILTRNLLGTIIMVVCWGIVLPIILIKYCFKRCIYELLTKFPLYNLVNEYFVVMIMSVIMNSGINIITGINYCCEDGVNREVNKVLKVIGKEVMNGNKITDSMEKAGRFSSYTLAHIRLGEESGGLDERLTLLEKETFNRVIEGLNKTLKLVQPILIIFIVIAILIFFSVFILPLLDALML